MRWSTEDINALNISDVESKDLDEIKFLLDTNRARFATNYKRTLYCDTEQAFKDIGLAMPPQLKKVNYVLGWSNMAVKKPAMRCQFDGLRLPGSDDPFELNQILDENHFGLEFGQAIQAANRHGVSLVTVAKGAPGESAVQIIGHSAESSACIWDRRTRRLRSALTISSVNEEGKPTEFVVYLKDKVLTCTKSKETGWSAKSQENRTGRVMAVPVKHDPQLTSPLGRSRLTRAVMRLNDVAVRTVARMEGNAEFYASPQLALLGVDYEAFYGENAVSDSEKFQLAMDRVLAISKDEDGDRPTLQQMQQATMTPHSDMLRSTAMLFTGETGIPPSSLGVIHDQPASAEAIRAAEHDLLIDVTYQNRYVLPASVKEIAVLVVMVRDNLREPPEEAWKLSSRFADPEFRSLSAESDAVQKLAQSMNNLAQWPVLMERIFDGDQIERIQADARRSQWTTFLDQATARANGQEVQQAVEAGGANAVAANGSRTVQPGDESADILNAG